MKRIALHGVRLSGITLAIVFCTFYPFLPGRYDGLAVTLSLMAQLLGVTGVLVGIPQYHYALSGAAYNLYFELPVFQLTNPGTREIVMYNKLDQHAMPSHDSDILLWTPEQLEDRRGWHSVHDASSPHWKYFWFD